MQPRVQLPHSNFAGRQIAAIGLVNFHLRTPAFTRVHPPRPTVHTFVPLANLPLRQGSPIQTPNKSRLLISTALPLPRHEGGSFRKCRTRAPRVLPRTSALQGFTKRSQVNSEGDRREFLFFSLARETGGSLPESGSRHARPRHSTFHPFPRAPTPLCVFTATVDAGAIVGGATRTDSTWSLRPCAAVFWPGRRFSGNAIL